MRDEEEEDEGRGGSGWIATLFGAALLLAAGFAVGVVVGAVREEPGMLLRYVTGRSADLPAPPARPAAAMTPSLPETASPRAAQPVIAPATPSEPAPQVASASRTRFVVQVGAFAQSLEAEKLEAQLRRKGLPAYVQPATGARDSRWRVRVGPLATRDEADRVAARLKTQEKLPVWVFEESG